jgi:hypothetical protein
MMLVTSLLAVGVLVEFARSLQAFAYIKRHVREGAVHDHNKRGNQVPAVWGYMRVYSSRLPYVKRGP